MTQSIELAIAAAVRQALEAKMPTETLTPEQRRERYCMTVKQLAERMQISLPSAYDLTHREGFPLITMGKKRLIPIEAFEKWLYEQAGKR